jgi:hypothetical protein
MRQSPNGVKPEFSHSKYQPGHCKQIAEWLLVVFFLVCVPCVKAQGDPNMSGVDDVLGGQRTILQVDDVFTPQGVLSDNAFAVSVNISPTDNSHLPIDSTVFQTLACNGQTFLISTQTGWMFNIPGQVIVSLKPCVDSVTGAPDWNLITTGNNYLSEVLTFIPSEGVPVPNSPQLAMRDFIGDGFDQALMICVNKNATGQFDLLARIAAANDPNNFSPSSGMRFGPAFPLPISTHSFSMTTRPSVLKQTAA